LLVSDVQSDSVLHSFQTLFRCKLLQDIKYSSLCACVCLVTQLCPTLCNPMDSSLPGSSVRRASPGKNTGVGCHALFQGIFPTQGSNPCLPNCRQILYHLSQQGRLDFPWGRYYGFGPCGFLRMGLGAEGCSVAILPAIIAMCSVPKGNRKSWHSLTVCITVALYP